jgi:heterodisulfide reductase subunit A
MDNEPQPQTDYDVMVIGSGIGGMESSIKLGDMGYKVLLVEKEASVGGRMILLSKVFPTLDCASCISGPKMSSTINHPNITTKNYSEVLGIDRDAGGVFHAKVKENSTFVDWSACTGCSECETACTVAMPDQFNYDLVARRAAYIAFPQAVPKKAVIERDGTSPCIAACPAGIKAHGYVSLARAGMYEEAFQLNLDATPLVGTLGRVCYAPCENGCTRSQLEGAVPMRMIKRFAADQHYASHEGPGIEVAAPNGLRVAVVGSGPAGLTAAWQLARKGYLITVLEAKHEPGGLPRHAIPSYRLPKNVLEADIANLAAIGVDIVCDHPVTDLLALKAEGYDAIVMAIGTQRVAGLEIPGASSPGVQSGLEFLSGPASGVMADLTGKRVVIVGGDNVAMDAARVSQRMGAAETTVVYGRGRKDLRCQDLEVDEAEKEGVKFTFEAVPVEVLTNPDGSVRSLKSQRMQPSAAEGAAKGSPEPAPGSEFEMPADLVINALGLEVDDTLYAQVAGGGTRSRIKANKKTLQTGAKWLFGAGDVANGATNMARAVGSGRRAAHMVDRFLQGQPLDGYTAQDNRLSTVKHPTVLGRQEQFTRREPVTGEVVLSQHPTDFSEIEAAFTEEQARAGAGSCLDCGGCSECQECVKACPADAINFEKRDKTMDFTVGAVVVSTGYKLFAADLKPEYGYGTYANVITGTQMDRLLAPTRPFNTILRPGDGKVPDRIAYVSCTGSRDKTTGNPLCSKVCCMYSVKQNQLIMGSLPLADVTMHYMDIRAAGKRYNEFYEQSKDMGATYIKGRVAKITEKDNGDLILRYEDIENGGKIVEAEYDLVVLAVGIQPNRDVEKLFTGEKLGLDEYFYVAEPDGDLDPGRTDIPGVFVAGTSAGAKDIVDTILHAGAAVAQVAAHLEHSKSAQLTATPEMTEALV